jgi:NitT/TauT family transport system substrate-binding protein
MARKTLAALVLPLLLVLAACGYGSQASTKAAPTAAGGAKLSVDAVTIGYLPNVTHATALVGVQEGIIAKELGGTTLKTFTFNAGPSLIEALNAGSIDIGWVGPSPTVNGYARSGGKNLRIISGSASGGVKLVVNPRISSPNDVKGKRIATPQLGNTQDVALLNWIASRGWTVDARTGKGDVSVLRADNAEIPHAYKSGAIDGAWVPEPTAAKMVAEGAKVLVDESTLWPDGKFVTTNVIVSQRFLAEHPDVVEAVLRGSVASNAWINANPAAAKKSANAAILALTGKPLPTKVLDQAWGSLEITNDPLATTLKTQARHAVAAGLIEQPNLTGIYDLKPLNNVLRSSGQVGVDDANLGAR